MSLLRTNLAPRSLLAVVACVISVATGSPAAAQTEPATPATALEPATRPASTPVERANADAVARLYEQLAVEPLTGGISVGQLLDVVDGRLAVLDGLSRAQQIGGPRTLAEGIVQVNLEVAGSRASALVLEAAQLQPERSPIPPQRLAELLKPWAGRTFASTGDSAADERRTDARASGIDAARDVGAARAPLVLPARTPAWVEDPITASATAEGTGAALRTARAAEAAARGVLREQIAKLPLDEQRTLERAAAEHRGVASAIDRSVEAAKIAGVDYRADGSVEVRVWIDGRQLWQALQLER